MSKIAERLRAAGDIEAADHIERLEVIEQGSGSLCERCGWNTVMADHGCMKCEWERLSGDEARMTETVMVLDRKLTSARKQIEDMRNEAGELEGFEFGDYGRATDGIARKLFSERYPKFKWNQAEWRRKLCQHDAPKMLRGEYGRAWLDAIAYGGIKEARALIAEMKAALEPFAVRAAVYDPPNGDDGDLDWFNGGRVITVGDFRRARDLYERTTP